MPRPADNEIAVLGAGIIGLTSGLQLLEAGWRVVIHAREVTPGTTSSVAGAFWFPYRAAPASRVRVWGNQSRRRYEAMMRQGIPGVRIAPLHILQRAATPALVLEGWIDDAVPLREIPSGFSQGLHLQVPVIEPPLLLSWVQEEFLRRGGRIERREIHFIDELFARHPLVVNCPGAWARDIAPDPTVFPIRGEVLRVARPPGLPDTILLHEEDDVMTYIIPRSRDCVLGGTAEDGVWDRTPDAGKGASIHRRCLELLPALAGAEIQSHVVGLRPGRPEVRLELEPRGADRAVIHNYGHGGAGFTLAWGCAEEVARIAGAHRCDKD